MRQKVSSTSPFNHLNAVNCNGSENILTECAHIGFTVYYCPSEVFGPAGVSCSCKYYNTLPLSKDKNTVVVCTIISK